MSSTRRRHRPRRAATTPASPGTACDSPMTAGQVWSLAIDPTTPNHARRYRGTVPRRDVPHRRRRHHLGAAPPEIPEFCAGVSRPRILTATVDEYRPQVGSGSASRRAGCGAAGTAATRWARSTAPPRTSPRRHQLRRALRRGPPGPAQDAGGPVVNALFVSPTTAGRGPVPIPGSTWGIYYTRLVRACPVPMSSCSASATGHPGPQTRSSAPTTWPGPGSVVSRHPGELHRVGLRRAPGRPRARLRRDQVRATCSARTDAGRSGKEWREFPEITDVAWTPATAPAPEGH